MCFSDENRWRYLQKKLIFHKDRVHLPFGKFKRNPLPPPRSILPQEEIVPREGGVVHQVWRIGREELQEKDKSENERGSDHKEGESEAPCYGAWEQVSRKPPVSSHQSLCHSGRLNWILSKRNACHLPQHLLRLISREGGHRDTQPQRGDFAG